MREDDDLISNNVSYFCILQSANGEISVNPTYSTLENTYSTVGRQAQPQTLYFLLPCPSQCLILALFSFLSVLSLCS